MRMVFVNQCHPDTPHVCAVRLREFAAAMARRGHQVVLLTETLGADGTQQKPGRLEDRLAGHDWRAPLHVGCPRAPSPVLERLHDGRLWFGIRKAVVATSFVWRGGVFAHWTEGTRQTATVLAAAFRPDIVWGTFGCTDVWNVAKRIAAAAGCPWVADIKDNWEVFIPFGLRTLLARRYAGAAHFTALSEGHAEIALKRFRSTATVVHSGFSRDIATDGMPDGGSDSFRIVAGGSIYDGKGFAAIVGGIRQWLSERGPDDPVEFRYTGNEYQQVAALVAPLSSRCRIFVGPFLPQPEFQAMLAGASVIVYGRNAVMPQHQKFIEYIATGRPVLCFPGETEEFITLARSLNGALFSCETMADVTNALSAIKAGRVPVLDRQGLEAYSWDAQAAILEGALRAILQRSLTATAH